MVTPLVLQRGVRPFRTSSLSDRAAWPSYHFGFTFPRCHTYFAHHRSPTHFAHHRSLSSFPSFFPSISPLSLSIHSFAHPHAAMNRCRPPCKWLKGHSDLNTGVASPHFKHSRSSSPFSLPWPRPMTPVRSLSRRRLSMSPHGSSRLGHSDLALYSFRFDSFCFSSFFFVFLRLLPSLSLA